MNYRTSTAVLGILAIASLVVVAIASFVDSFALEATGATEHLLAPVLGSLAVAALVVLGLAILGSRSRRWLANPYW
ncbi:hypothetical protein [Halostagnicola bangensis]